MKMMIGWGRQRFQIKEHHKQKHGMVKDVGTNLVMLEPFTTGNESWEALGTWSQSTPGLCAGTRSCNIGQRLQTWSLEVKPTLPMYCLAGTQCLYSEYNGWRQGTDSPAEPPSTGPLPSSTSSASFLKTFELASPE